MAKYVFNKDYTVSEYLWNNKNLSNKYSFKSGEEIEAEYPPNDFDKYFDIQPNSVISNYDGTSPDFNKVKNGESYTLITIPRDYLNTIVQGSNSTTDNQNSKPQKTNNKKYLIIGSIAILAIASTIIYFTATRK